MIAWLLELIGKDSELSGYKLIQAQLGHLFRFLPERSRFNRRRRKLWSAEKYAQLATALSKEKNGSILLFAGPNERKLQAQVADMMTTPLTPLIKGEWIYHRFLLKPKTYEKLLR